MLLILFSWILVRIIRPKKLIESARNHLGKAKNEKEVEKSFKSRIHKAEKSM